MKSFPRMRLPFLRSRVSLVRYVIVATCQPMLGKCETKELNQVEDLAGKALARLMQLLKLWIAWQVILAKGIHLNLLRRLVRKRTSFDLSLVKLLGESELLGAYDVLTKIWESSIFLFPTQLKKPWLLSQIRSLMTGLFWGWLNLFGWSVNLLDIILIVDHIT